MTKCKYRDSGWCYCPDTIENTAIQGYCFEPEHCPEFRKQATQEEPIMTYDKQLAEELYEALKVAEPYIYSPDYYSQSKISNVLKKYEEQKYRGTGRTTALYMQAIADALANPGKAVEFIDHFPVTCNVSRHASNITSIIEKLGYNISVSINSKKVILCNTFRGVGR
jgi:predicted GTPase